MHILQAEHVCSLHTAMHGGIHCVLHRVTAANAIATIAVLTKLKIVCEERGPPTIYIHTSHLQENSSLARCQLPVLYIIRISAPGNIPKASEPIMIACRREVQGSLYETRQVRMRRNSASRGSCEDDYVC